MSSKKSHLYLFHCSCWSIKNWNFQGFTLVFSQKVWKICLQNLQNKQNFFFYKQKFGKSKRFLPPKPEIAQLQGFYCIFNWQYFQFWSKISIFFFSVAKSRCWFDEADVEKFGHRKRKEGSRNAWKPCFEKKTRAFWLKALKIRWLFSLYKHKRSNLFLFFFLSKKTFKFTRFF